MSQEAVEFWTVLTKRCTTWQSKSEIVPISGFIAKGLMFRKLSLKKFSMGKIEYDQS